MRTLTAATLWSAVLLSGCVTTQGPGLSDTLLKPLGLETSDLTDTFSPGMREVKKLVEAGSLDAAEQALLKEREYFSNRLADASKPLPAELQRLGTHVWNKHYAVRVAQSTQRLSGITSALQRERWLEQARDLKAARQLSAALDEDFAVKVLRLGAADQRNLKGQLQRVDALAAASRSQALALTFEDVLAKGTHEPVYLGTNFGLSDYTQSSEFQRLALQRLAAQGDRAALSASASKLTPYLGSTSRAAADTQFAESVRRELLADGRVTLEEMSSLAGLKTPFGGAGDVLAGVVRVGYVDLTSASFKNRNIFDFEIAFKQDLALTFSAADESVFRTVDWAGYDYLFVTDLALAKVSREFKSRNSAKSRARTGERQEANPAYVGAVSAYQQSMAEYQRAQINAAAPKACTGWGCVLVAMADGLAQSAAKSKVDETSKVLASTSQTVSIPVFSEYTYQLVGISTTKTADVNYYVIDTKGKRILRSSFQVTDHETFNVAYNVRDEDPDKSSILRNVKTENEVTAWEKRPLAVKLSALFSPDSLRSANATALTDVPTFVASLNSRPVVSASPTYVRGGTAAGATAVSSAGAQLTSLRDSASGASQTIADERFDSIVIVQNPSSSGTGFYVTPELVLTAYHVVEKNALVQLTFYDGTKTFGRVVDHDIRLDLALVRAQMVGKPLKIHSGPLRLGETVEAIGHPKGYEFTITRGVVSAMRRQRSATIGSDVLVEFVQTDTPISPGNSGGPLLLKDVVIGVNDWIRVDKGSQNLNFSVSYNEIRSFLDRFQAK